MRSQRFKNATAQGPAQEGNEIQVTPSLLFSKAKPNCGSRARRLGGSKVKGLRIGRCLILLRVRDGWGGREDTLQSGVPFGMPSWDVLLLVVGKPGGPARGSGLQRVLSAGHG